MKQKIILAVTGASGSVYGMSLLANLLKLGYRVDLIISRHGGEVMKHEIGVEPQETNIINHLQYDYNVKPDTVNLNIYDNDDMFSPPASGSAGYGTMIIIPASMKTVASIATGLSSTLLERAADVILKEKKKLVLVPRETPLSSIHLRNMLTLSQDGAHIVPAMPGFYNNPENITDLISFVVGKVMKTIGISDSGYPYWGRDED